MDYLKFRLDIYNKDIKTFLEKNKRIEEFLSKKFVKKYFGMTHEEMFQKGWINETWLPFLDWINEWHLFGRGLLFRGVRFYSFKKLKRILETGTDKTYLGRSEERYMISADEKIKKKFGLSEEQWIWATPCFDIAWLFSDYEQEGRDGNRIIIIYDKSKLR